MKNQRFLIGCFGIILSFNIIIKAEKPAEFIYYERLIYLEMTANECEELLFLFDTGASKSAIDIKTAERIKLPISGNSKVEGSAGTIEVKNARIKSLFFGGAEVSDLEVTAYDLSGVLAPPGRRVDGILGYDFLRHFVIEIDYVKQTMSFSKTSNPKTCRHMVLPFTLDNNIPRIKGIINGKIKADFRLDTGASLFETGDIYVNTTQRIWNKLTKLDPKLKPETYFTGSGIGGTVKLAVARIKSFSAGDVKADKVFIIVQPKAGYFARKDAVGFISNNFLEKYSPVTIDYLTRTILLTN